MNQQLFDILGKLISSMVSMVVIFRYFDDRYIRAYKNKGIYKLLMIGSLGLNLVIAALNIPFVNISYWFIIVSLLGKFFYYDNNLKGFKYYILNIVYLLVVSTFEGVGVILLDIVIKVMRIDSSLWIISYVKTVTGSIITIFSYYLFLKWLFNRKKVEYISAKQYAIYAVITAYVLVNIGEILFLIKSELSRRDYIFLLADSFFIILVNIYLFHLLDAFAENKDLKYKLALYESQSRSNYNYYAKQVEGYKTALAVIHDVRKHIRIIEELKEEGAQVELKSYMNQFEDILLPLLNNHYVDNVILNIIINDKVSYCRKHDICFEVTCPGVNVDFMEQVDITTVFGNILDNAIEACEASKEKRMSLTISSFNEFIYVQLSNTFSGNIRMNEKGKPITSKGEGHGIGLENVEKALKKYNGEMQCWVIDDLFTIELMFNPT